MGRKRSFLGFLAALFVAFFTADVFGYFCPTTVTTCDSSIWKNAGFDTPEDYCKSEKNNGGNFPNFDDSTCKCYKEVTFCVDTSNKKCTINIGSGSSYSGIECGPKRCYADEPCDFPTLTDCGDIYSGGWDEKPKCSVGITSHNGDDQLADTYYACFVAYNITYVLDSGTNYTGAPTTYTYGVGATINGVPKRDKYLFAGWCTDSAKTSCSMSQTISTTDTGDKTFYAKWESCGTCTKNTGVESCSIKVLNNECSATATCSTGYNTPICSGTKCSCTPNTYKVSYGSNKPNSATASIKGSTTDSTHTFDVTKALTTNGFSLKGWKFIGWNTKSDGTGKSYTDGESVKNLTSTNGETFKLYAQWAPNTFKVTFNSNSATSGIPSATSVTCTYDSTCTAATQNTLLKTNSVFGGWNTTAAGTGTNYNAGGSITNISTSDIELYAKWTTCTTCAAGMGATCSLSVSNNTCVYTTECKDGYDNIKNNGKYNPSCTAIKYNISYDLGDSGTNYTDAPTTYTYGVGATISGVPKRDKYLFAGWCTDSAKTSCSMSQTISTTDTGDKIFYAKWDECTCTKGNKVSSCSVTGTASAGTLSNACVYSYNCETGYNTSGTFTGNAGVANNTMPNCTANSYTITIDKNGGTGSLTVNGNTKTGTDNISFSCNHGSTFTMPAWDGSANALTNGTSVFTGWSTSGTITCNGNKTITAQWSVCKCTPGSNVSSCSPMTTTSNKCVYSYTCATGYGTSGSFTATEAGVAANKSKDCSGNSITVDYNENGGSAVTNGSCTYGGSLTLASAPSRTGYSFDGWKLADGTVKSAGTSVTCNNTNLGVTTGTSTGIVAQWTANTYTVTYSCGDGTGTPPTNGTATYNANFTPAANTCTRSGYTFAGWNDGSTIRVAGTAFKWTYTSNKTFTAKWTAGAAQTITYNVGDYGTINGDYITACNADSPTFSLPTNVTRAGYEFKGWYDNVNLSGTKIEHVSQGSCTSALTFWAKWEATCNTITLDNTTNGGSGGTTVIYKKTDSTTFYSDSSCETTITSVTKPSKTNATYAGTYTSSATSGGTQCITNAGTLSTSTSCNVTGTTTWYARYSCNANYRGAGTTITGVCTPSVYTITLRNYNDSSTHSTIYQKYATGWYSDSGATTTLSVAPVPTRNGYKFRGFYTATQSDLSASGGVGTRSITAAGGLPGNTTFTDNSSLYAAWAKDCATPTNGTCSLTINSDGTATYTASCDAGYTVSGANTATPSCNANCYAITLNANGGTVGSIATLYKKTGDGTWYTNSSCTSAYSATTSIVPTRTGFTFRGFYSTDLDDVASDNSDGTPYITKAGASSSAGTSWTVTGNKTIYAAWAKNCATPSNGTCSLSVNDAGAVDYLTSCEAGYTISGNNTATPGCSMNTVTINYNTSGANGVPSTTLTQTCPYDGTCNVAEVGTMAKDNMVFLGWTKTSGGTTVDYVAGASIDTTTINVSITLYAVWQTPTCSATNGSATLESVTNNKPVCIITCLTGYSQSGGTNTTTSFKVTGDAGETSVSASCKAQTAVVSFNANGGTGGQSSSVTATYGSPMPTISTTKPTKAGCQFMGWYDNATHSSGTQYYTNTAASARTWDKMTDLALYAGWDCMTVEAENKTLSYTGSAQSCGTVSLELPIPYTVTYRNGGSGEWSSNPPTLTNAGSITVYYKITADGYSAYEGSYTCTVTQGMDNVIIMEGTTNVTNSSGRTAYPNTKSLTVTCPDGATATVSSATTSVATAINSNNTVTLTPNQTGSSVITVNCPATTNYLASSANYTWTVDPGTINASHSANGKTYDGTALTCDGNISISAPTSGTTIAYGTMDGTYDLTSAPKITNVADSKTIYYQITANNYTAKTGSFNCTINKATMNASMAGNSKPYDGTALTCDGGTKTNVPSGSTITYGTSAGSYSAGAPKVTNVADSKTIYYKIANNNYNDYAGSFNCTVSNAEIQVSASNKTLNYTGSAQGCGTVNVIVPSSGATVKYGTTSNDISSASQITKIDAGTYTIYYQVTANNYATKTGSFNCTINKVSIVCNAGTYYPGTGDNCAECTSGSYCEGVSAFQHTGEAGRSSCTSLTSGLYTESAPSSDSASDCYKVCEPYEIVNGTAVPVSDKAYYPSECEFKGISTTGNPCDIIDGVCIVTSCNYNFEIDNGVCKPCDREHAISYKKEGNCVVESCANGYHPNGQKCEYDIVECSAPNAVIARRTWDITKNAFGACIILECEEGYHLGENACQLDEQVCELEHGVGMREWNHKANTWGECIATKCEPGYTNDPSLTNELWKQCGRCDNMYSANGELAVSSWVSGCEIAACMYQGELYTLENNECRLICDTYSDETGSRRWNSSRKKCERTCAPGYTSW